MRDFRTPFSTNLLNGLQAGTMSYRYKDTPCLKSPIDIAIYLRLLWLEKPKTLIEIGSKYGGSALLFSDLLKLMDLGCKIVSIDINPPPEIKIDDVRFIQGDILKIEEVFAQNRLTSLPRPWLIVEDSAHTFSACMHALKFFASHMKAGEILAMEDGILTELGLAEQYAGGPSRAIEEFLVEFPDSFDIETNYCDMFGYNTTYNPNGYLRKK